MQKIVKYVRCDNAGENKSLEKDAKRDGLGIQFEYANKMEGSRESLRFCMGELESCLRKLDLLKNLRMRYGVKAPLRQLFSKI